MTEETAKALIDAIDRLAGVMGQLASPGYLGGGIHVTHHGIPSYPQYQPQFNQWPAYSPYPYQTISQTGGQGGTQQ